MKQHVPELRRTPRVYVVGLRHVDRRAWARHVRQHVRDPVLPVCTHEHDRDAVIEYGAARQIVAGECDWAWAPGDPDPCHDRDPPLPTLEQLAASVGQADPSLSVVAQKPKPAPGPYTGPPLWFAFTILTWIVAAAVGAGLFVVAGWIYWQVAEFYIATFQVMCFLVPAALFLALAMRTFIPLQFLYNLVIGAFYLAAMPFGGLFLLFKRRKDDT